jgi:hypothetical protein
MREHIQYYLQAAWGIILGVLQILAFLLVLVTVGRLLLGMPL